jgi:hypothetical protein
MQGNKKFIFIFIQGKEYAAVINNITFHILLRNPYD